jgi:cytochrome c oxidase subunit 4
MSERSAHHRVGHVVPLRLLFGVLAILLVMTYVTVAASWLHFGRFNLWIALGIAVFKASLVLLFFMHLKYDKPFNAVVVIVSLGLLMLFIVAVLDDTSEYKPNQIPGYAPSIQTNPQ